MVSAIIVYLEEAIQQSILWGSVIAKSDEPIVQTLLSRINFKTYIANFGAHVPNQYAGQSLVMNLVS